MKICIVTWFSSPNYGTFLQAFALQRFLEKNNYHNEIVNFKPNSFFINDIRHICFYLFPWLKKSMEYQYTKMIFDSFAKKNLLLTEKVSLKNINKLNKKYDLFISGSDQIWNPEGVYKNTYLLDFTDDDKKRISISTSMGGGIPEGYSKEEYKSLLSRYSFISVRENTTNLFLRSLLQRDDIKTSLDPVFLLNKEDWLEIIPEKTHKVQSYICCYFLGYNSFYKDRIIEIHNKYPEKKIILLCLGNENIPDLDFIEAVYFKTPFDFLAYLRDSSFVVTDSFHATVFSIILEKKFIHFKRFLENQNNQNVRVYELLQLVDCSELLVSNDDLINWEFFEQKTINSIVLKQEIDKNKDMILQVLDGIKSEL